MMRHHARPDHSITFELHQARLSVEGRVPAHREGLRQAIAALTETASLPLPDVPVAPTLRPLLATLTPAQREKDRILCEAWDGLGPDQRAALRVAESLAASEAGSLRQSGLGCLVQALLLAGYAWWSLSGAGGIVGPTIVAVGLLWVLGNPHRASFRNDARDKRMEEADLKVALAMDHPGRYLQALEKLEAAEFAGWELLRGEVQMKRPYSHRCERLYARLGFTRSPKSSVAPVHHDSQRGCLQDHVRPGTPPATAEDIDRAMEAAVAAEYHRDPL